MRVALLRVMVFGRYPIMTRLQLAYSLIPYFVVRFTASGDLSLCGLIKKEPPDLSIVKRLGDYCCRL